MINLVLSLIAFLGLIAGWFIRKYTKEEIKSGKKYFIWLNKAIALVLILVLLYLNLNVYFLIIGIVLGYFIRQSYLYLGLVSFDFVNYFIFLFGLGYSALEKYSKKILILSFVMFFVGVLIANIYKIDGYYSLVAGALLWRLLDAVPDKFRII